MFFKAFFRKAFKESIIRPAWKKAGLIPYNLVLVVDKIWDELFPARNIIPPPPDLIPLDKTPKSIEDMRESVFNQLTNALMPEEFCQTWAKFAKSACQIA